MAIEAAAGPVAPVAPPAPASAEEAAAAPVADAAAPVADTTEGSWIGRIVALITPFFALAAAWIAGVVTKIIPGVTLDKSQIIALMVAAATSVLTAAWKWLQGWQQHEQNVADRRSQPVRRAAAPKEPYPTLSEALSKLRRRPRAIRG